MPFLYEIDESRDERPLASAPSRTCMSCGVIAVGTVDVEGVAVVVGFCSKYNCFFSEEELNEDRQLEYCWV